MPQKARSFGADDKPVCPKCSEYLFVGRRSLHPTVMQGEYQALQCMKCDYMTERVVNKDGTVIS